MDTKDLPMSPALFPGTERLTSDLEIAKVRFPRDIKYPPLGV